MSSQLLALSCALLLAPTSTVPAAATSGAATPRPSATTSPDSPAVSPRPSAATSPDTSAAATPRPSAATSPDTSATPTPGTPTPSSPQPVAQARPIASDNSRAQPRVPTTTSIDVIGEAPEALQAVPGSAAVVDEKQLELTTPLSATEVLRTVTGLHIVEEDGIGLRSNIGFRGLDPDRSRTVLVLEDGVPISMGPYGGPELYYSPPVERMRRLEVVKGSGSILFGPQTIGGVVNYITPEPPDERTLEAEARYGAYSYGLGRVGIGETRGQVGYLVQAMYQTFDGARDLNLRRVDLNGKLRLELGPGAWLGVKLNVYNEISNATYLGLTTPQYDAGLWDNFASYDFFAVRRYAMAVNHAWFATPNLFVRTVAYGHTVDRRWRRQDYDRIDCHREEPVPDDCADYERIIDGNGDLVESAPSDGSAVFFEDAAGNRNRAYRVAGIESQLAWSYHLGLGEGELTAGARLHYEDADIKYIQGDFAASSTGIPLEDERRATRALAVYAVNRFTLLHRLRLSPGVRLEALVTERTLLRGNVDPETGQPSSAEDAVLGDLNPPIDATAPLVAIIPGLGLSYDAARPLTLFAGVHRGFAPPRTQDAISDDGRNLELEPEYSWNYELGTRWRVEDLLEAEVAGFYLDFQNQVIPPAESSGSVSDKLVNGGSTWHAGVEMHLAADPAAKAGLGFQLPLSVNYTFVRARFSEECDAEASGSTTEGETSAGCWSTAIRGNYLPYAPEHMVTAQVGFIHPAGPAAQLTANWVSAQFTDKENTIEPSVDGLRGAIDPRLLIDARLSWTFREKYTLSLTGKNLTDTRYIASRRPAGIQPGSPRQLIAGIEGRF